MLLIVGGITKWRFVVSSLTTDTSTSRSCARIQPSLMGASPPCRVLYSRSRMRSMAKAAICVEHGRKPFQLANWCMSYHKAVKSADSGDFVENAWLPNMNGGYGYFGRHHIPTNSVWFTSRLHTESAPIVPCLPSDSDIADTSWYRSS